MKDLCEKSRIDLHIVHGQPTATERHRGDTFELPWTDEVRNRTMRLGGTDLVWQPIPKVLRDADLVILQQENRALVNYPYFLWRRFGGPMLGFWGHGANLKSKAPDSLRERFRRRMLFEADHFFAYNQMAVDIVARAGYPAERITSLVNSIDTARLRREFAQVDSTAVEAVARSLSIPSGAPVALFCGSLYANRKLGLLVEAADRIRAALPDFHLVVIGGGADRRIIDAAAAERPWLHPVGPKNDQDKLPYFRLARVLLNPGAVGLVVLDCFVTGLPLITTANSYHGPEIDYFRDGETGLFAPDTPEGFAAATLRVLGDETFRTRLSRNCLANSENFSIEAMAENFVSGIKTCLSQGRLSVNLR
jgi:glycosyltransferase involved in cell wall biosynthesis